MNGVTAACTAAFAISVAVAGVTGISILWALLFGCVCFMAAALRLGFGLRELLRMMGGGVAIAMIVLRIFVLIGMLTGAWRSCGTISFFVYWGTRITAPDWFLLSAFIVTCVISFLLGTSFGTIGTIGVTLMILARGSGVDPTIAAGAVISGAYFGDRCSPTSSVANLIAAITKSSLIDNVKNMLRSGLVPFLLTVAFYAALSPFNPMTAKDGAMLAELAERYDLSPLTAVPALIILALPLMKVRVKTAMMFSIASACAIAFALQGESVPEIMRALTIGYRPAFGGRLAEIIAGGGLISMAKAAGIIIMASTYAGLFEGTGMFSALENVVLRLARKCGLFAAYLALALCTATLSCNQTLAVMLTHQLAHRARSEFKTSLAESALLLEDTAVLVSALIPWNIAAAVPLSVISAPASSLLFAAYLYLLPAWGLLRSRNRVQ